MRWTPEIEPRLWPHFVDLARVEVARHPDDAGRWVALAEALRRGGDLEAAAEALAEAVARGVTALSPPDEPEAPGGTTQATYERLLSLASTGDAEAARRLLPLDRCVTVTALPLAPGYADMAAFLGDVAGEILRNPSLAPDPRGKATRAGLQTRALRRADAPAVEALIAQIKRAVQDFAAGLAGQGDDFAQACPEVAALSGWAVVCGAEGYQASHYHPKGWLSGVAYIAGVRAPDEARYRGALRVGQLGSDYAGGAPPWGVVEVEPVPGRVVLFPSYTPHATAPSGLDGQRISVAFDVAPAR
jgi:hypothetical protein